MKNEHEMLVQNHKWKRPLERLDVDRIILKWTFLTLVVRVWTRFIWLRIGYSGGLL
jgi:hypothetical protein